MQTAIHWAHNGTLPGYVHEHTNSSSAGLTGYSSCGFPHQTIVALLQARQVSLCQGKESESWQEWDRPDRSGSRLQESRQQNTLGHWRPIDPFTNRDMQSLLPENKIDIECICFVVHSWKQLIDTPQICLNVTQDERAYYNQRKEAFVLTNVQPIKTKQSVMLHLLSEIHGFQNGFSIAIGLYCIFPFTLSIYTHIDEICKFSDFDL